MKSLKILIVGAGPGGLSAAIALAEAGHAVDLIERSATGAPVGAAITLTARAIDALGALGVLDHLRSLAGEAEWLRVGPVDAAGRSLASPPKAEAAPGGLPRESLGLYRPVLSAVMLGKARAVGVRVFLETRVAALDEAADLVRVTLTNGSSTDYDLVVGADGIRSDLRSRLFPEAPRPVYAGQSILRWMAPGPPIDHPSGTYHLPAGKILGYPLPKQQLIYVAMVVTEPQRDHVEPDEARARLRLGLSQIEASHGRALFDRLDDNSNVLWRPFEWLLLPAPWHRGRVVLIGDAAHSTTAHLSSGGGMAIEDGVVLAQSLAAAGDLEVALSAFTARRFARARTVVETSLACSHLEASGRSPAEVSALAATAFRLLMQPY